METIKNKLKNIRKTINVNPTEKQKESGNYKKGHISINGFNITIENPKNSYRSGVDSNGNEWKTKMNNDYGYFLNSEGYDGDHVDVFLGNDFSSKKIFVVDQFINGKFDESKVMLGFNDIDVAKENYLKNYEKDWKGFKKITEVSEEFFKEWLYDGKKQRKPFYDYKTVKKCKKMKIKESLLKTLIQESIKKVIIKEGRESTKLTNMLIKKLYKVAQNYKKKYHDDDWSNVHAMLDEMRQLEGIADLYVGDGRYRKHGEEFGEMTKVYKVNILTDFNTIINGNVNCHLCGTIDNPWSAYDISVSFYRESNSGEILESITKPLNESIDDEYFGEKPFYTMDDWRVDGSLKPEVGDYVEDEVIEELANSVPPTTYSRGIFQPGEAYDMSEEYTELYMTFVREQRGWKYVGLCPKGSTKQLPRIDYSQFNESIDKSNLLSELDWRTYASASEKARQLSDDAPDKYERMRRDRQRQAFYLRGNEEYSKQYGLEDFDKNENLPNSEKTRVPSQGELKRASQRIKDMTNFYQGKQEYKNGKWQDKEM